MHHILASLKQIDFVTAWKAVSIALTGGFGILGLLKDFKNKETNKITRWGWISLIGIIVSSACGIAAQLKESHDDAKKAFILASETNEMLHGIQRTLAPISSPTVSMNFFSNCEHQDNVSVCQSLLPGENHPRVFPVEIMFFESRKDIDLFNSKNEPGPLLDYLIRFNAVEKRSEEYFEASFSYEKAEILDNTGVLRSIIDFSGKWVLLTVPDEVANVHLMRFLITFEDGEQVGSNGPFDMVPVTGMTAPGYVFVLEPHFR